MLSQSGTQLAGAMGRDAGGARKVFLLPGFSSAWGLLLWAHQIQLLKGLLYGC